MPRNSRPSFIVEVPFEGSEDSAGPYVLDVYGTFVPPERGDRDTPEVAGHYEVSKVLNEGMKHETTPAEEKAIEEALEAKVEYEGLGTHRAYLEWTREYAHEDT